MGVNLARLFSYTLELERQLEEWRSKEAVWLKREQWLLDQIVQRNGGRPLNPPPPQPPVAQQPFKPARVRAVEELQKKVYDEEAERARLLRAAQAYKESL